MAKSDHGDRNLTPVHSSPSRRDILGVDPLCAAAFFQCAVENWGQSAVPGPARRRRDRGAAVWLCVMIERLPRSACMSSSLPGCRLRCESRQIAVCLTATVIAFLAGVPGTSAEAQRPGSSGAGALAASCVARSASEQFRAARVVFDGRMLAGPSVQGGPRRVLLSPARVRVIRYLKGHGPRVVKVQTALTQTALGVTGNSEGIEPIAGQRWRIYADRTRQPVTTSVCSGSRRSPG